MNPYSVLGVPVGATDDEIRKAYRKLCLECHPDRNPDDPRAEERFKQVSVAYTILSSQEKRQAYDLGLGDVETNIHNTVVNFMNAFGDFLEQYGLADDEEPPPPPKKKKKRAKKKPPPRRVVKCRMCNDKGYQLLRQGGASFRTPCRSCAT